MSEIKMINLYRCSSAENNELTVAKGADYFVTDYFDKIKVDTMNMKTATLQECMGIKYDANEKDGISHQRYCLYSGADKSSAIWELNETYPILTIIQVFVNPDLYQAEKFSDGENASMEVLMRRLSDYVNEIVKKKFVQTDAVRCEIYRLLTAGDFALVVRSKCVHDAYDIVTAVRGIQAAVSLPEKNRQEEMVFYTYSICGAYHANCQEVNTVHWSKCLSEEDRVVVRIRYAQKFRKNQDEHSQKLKNDLVQFGEHLFGRYDHQISYTPDEFEKIYPYIRMFKVPKEFPPVTKNFSDKERLLINMMALGYVSHVNERLLLHYAQDPLLENENGPRWEMTSSTSWMSLYEQNNRKIAEIKERIIRKTDGLGERLAPYYQSERNLKECIRLMGRLGRVFYEINKRQELRISLAHLLVQYETLVCSLEEYIKLISEKERKYYAEILEKNIRYGISALEIFTRYMRNVNQQTLQTPNYDLQTNVSVVKLLLAYSQFLQGYVVKKEKKDDPYFSSKNFHSIVVPSMRVGDMSVGVLFDRTFKEEADIAPLLMVIYCPTFAFLCETCFLIPAVFHEIAHQFRYESRDERNRWLKRAVLKGYLYEVLHNILDTDRKYDFEGYDFLKEIVNKVYEKTFCTVLQESQNAGLQEFKSELAEALIVFGAVADGEKNTAEKAVRRYIAMTKDSIQDYNDDLLKILADINTKLKKMEADKESHQERFVLQMDLKYDVKKLKTIQEHDICQSILGVIESLGETEKSLLGEFQELLSCQSQLGKSDFNRSWRDDVGISADKILEQKFPENWYESTEQFLNNYASERLGERLFEVWKTADKALDTLDQTDRGSREKIQEIRHLLKQYHNINFLYHQFIYNDSYKIEDIEPELEERKKQYRSFEQKLKLQTILSQTYQMIRDELQDKLKEFVEKRSCRLEWEENVIPIERLQYIARAIRMEGIAESDCGIKDAFAKVSKTDSIVEFVEQNVELYREVTSDLFMCAVMNLDMFGYLVVAAEVLKFNALNYPRQLQRVFLVEQCLAMKVDDGIDKEEFYEHIEDRKNQFHCEFQKKLRDELVKQLKELNRGIQNADLVNDAPQVKIRLNALVKQLEEESLENCLDKIQILLETCIVKGSESFASTKNWVIRIHRQIMALTTRLLHLDSSWNAVGDREMICDIVCSGYMRKQEQIINYLRENGDGQLQEVISDILNSPASYFIEKKLMLQYEVDFVFDKYEKSCRKIFESTGD